MKTSEISKLNKNIETLNSNIERLISLVSNNHSNNEILETSPIFVDMPKVLNLSQDLMSKGLELSNDIQGFSTVRVIDEVVAKKCKSNCFEQVQYDPHLKELSVFFKGNRINKPYTYKGISKKLFKEFITSPSLGQFYISNIKNKFSFRK